MRRTANLASERSNCLLPPPANLPNRISVRQRSMAYPLDGPQLAQAFRAVADYLEFRALLCIERNRWRRPSAGRSSRKACAGSSVRFMNCMYYRRAATNRWHCHRRAEASRSGGPHRSSAAPPQASSRTVSHALHADGSRLLGSGLPLAERKARRLPPARGLNGPSGSPPPAARCRAAIRS